MVKNWGVWGGEGAAWLVFNLFKDTNVYLRICMHISPLYMLETMNVSQFRCLIFFARWRSSCLGVSWQAESCFQPLLSSSRPPPPLPPLLPPTCMEEREEGRGGGPSFNHIMFIYTWTHIIIYLFLFNVSIYITSRLNWNLYVVAGLITVPWLLSECFQIRGWNTFFLACLPLQVFCFVFLLFPSCLSCKDAFIPHYIQVHQPVRGQLGGICQLKGCNSLGLCLKNKTQ